MPDVQLFGMARERLGRPVATVGPATTVGELRAHLIADYPELASLVARAQVAVNRRLELDSAAIDADAELALILPVSGG